MSSSACLLISLTSPACTFLRTRVLCEKQRARLKAQGIARPVVTRSTPPPLFFVRNPNGRDGFPPAIITDRTGLALLRNHASFQLKIPQRYEMSANGYSFSRKLTNVTKKQIRKSSYFAKQHSQRKTAGRRIPNSSIEEQPES